MNLSGGHVGMTGDGLYDGSLGTDFSGFIAISVSAFGPGLSYLPVFDRLDGLTDHLTKTILQLYVPEYRVAV